MKGTKTGGRQKGTPNKATREAKAFCASIIENPRYQRHLRERVHKGTLPPALEAMLWHYAYGVPKQTVAVEGKPLLDHVLDRLAAAGVGTAIVNVHYFADQIVRHVQGRQRPRVVISDERDQILGTGGGVVKALPLLGDAPFFHLNSDTIWIEGPRPNLDRLASAFDAGMMDALLLMAPTATSIGYDGRGDYAMAPDGATVSGNPPGGGLDRRSLG